MAAIAEYVFKYPAEEECLIRRLGSGVIAAWKQLPEESRDLILKQAGVVWDREYNISRLPDRLEAIIRRGAR